MRRDAGRDGALRRELERRVRELEAIRRADEVLYRSLHVDDVLQAFVEVAAEQVGADKTSVMVWDERGERMVVRAMHGFSPAMAGFSLPRGQGMAGHVVATGRPAVVEDAPADQRVARYVVEQEGVRSLMAIPVIVGGEVIGVFGVNYTRRHSFGDDERHMLLALAQRAAAAIENARLVDQAERRSRELEALLEVSRNVVGTLALEPLLGVILDQLRGLVDYSAAAIMTVDGQELVIAGYRGRPGDPDPLGVRFPLVVPGLTEFLEGMARGEPVILDDVRGEGPLARGLLRLLDPNGRDIPPHFRAWLGVPLVLKRQIIGLLSIWSAEPGYFSAHHARLALGVADQAAVAIENARLYEAARGRAALEERQRLARELHDAVTQTLFSASLIAEVLPRLWDRDPAEARARLEELRQLTRGALAEMRTLLLELRPAALVETGLADLLRQLTEAFVGRVRVPCTLEVEGDAAVPPEVQTALYRVAQEALNNAAKYASPSRVEVRLRLGPGRAALRVRDDGRGFDPAAVRPGHFGLEIMRERCQAVGADLCVESAPGAGTRILAEWTGPNS
ncbi:MAG TPA: GAF domain-containing sensor histidine kinase [Chloroflexota bacterium]